MGRTLKALILAGGYATRLRPLSYNKPKLLFPLLGKPLLKKNLEMLAKIGVTEVVLALNYLSEVLMEEMGSRYAGITLQYSHEQKPLGTGGPIKNASKFFEGEDMFLAMNGDVLFDEDIKMVIEEHRKSGAVATLTLRHVEDTSRFGVALVDRGGWIRGFVEKPKPGEVESTLVNAGFYAFSSQILEYIPSGRQVSIEKEVYPILAQKEKLHSITYEGYWFDIGTVDDFVNANRWFLKSLPDDKIVVDSSANIESNVILKPPVSVGRGSSIGKRSTVGPYTVIGNGCKIGGDSQISQSILFDNCIIGEKVEFFDDIVGDNVSVGNNSKLMKRVVVGSGVTIRDRISIAKDVSIGPNKSIKENITESGCIM